VSPLTALTQGLRYRAACDGYVKNNYKTVFTTDGHSMQLPTLQS